MKKLIGTATTLLLLGAITPIYQKDVDKSINYNASAQVGDALVNISLFGGSDHETIGSVVRTSDGGFIVTGSTKSNGTGDIPAHSAVTGTRIGFLAKYDAQKVREWTSVLDSIPQNTNFKGAVEVAGVGYLAVGSIDNAGSGKSFDAIMTTVSTEGAVIRTTSYGGVNEESYEGVAKAPDGTIYAVGFTSSPLVDGFGTTYGSEDMLVTKIAADGQTLAWHKTYGGTDGGSRLHSAAVDNSGILYASGMTGAGATGIFSTAAAGEIDATMIAINPSGELQWSNRFGGTGRDNFLATTITTDGNIIAAGRSNSSIINGTDVFNSGDHDALAVKVDKTTGNTEWLSTWGGSGFDGFWGVVPLSDGTVAAVGSTQSPVSGDIETVYGGSDVLLTRIDPTVGDGTTTTFGGPDNDGAAGVWETADGRLVIVGETTSSFTTYGAPNNGGQDVFFFIQTFAPTITLPSRTIIRYQGQELNLLDGVTAHDVDDGDLTSSVELVDAPTDTSIIGEFVFTYSVTDSDGNTTTESATLIVNAQEPPILTVPGTATIQPGDSFDPMAGVSATDPDGDNGSSLDITSSVTFTGMPADTNTPNTYTITYRVEDAQGNITTADRTLIIQEKPVILVLVMSALILMEHLIQWLLLVRLIKRMKTLH